METLEYYVRAYGYVGIVLFAMIGGEEVALMGGVLAREGYLSLPAVIASAALGGSLGDQAYFHFARFCGLRLFQRSSKFMRAYPKAQGLVEKYGPAVAFASRFATGMRIAISTACGVGGMRPVLFGLLNFIGAVLWSSLYTVLAYRFGRTIWQKLVSLPDYLLWLIPLLLAGGILGYHWLRRSANARS
jgi:membrane protein DedA with SNARE-associated domain